MDGVCAHLNFRAGARIDRIEDIGEFTVDFTVECTDCGMPFRFRGLSSGSSPHHPMTDITQMELRCPIEPVEATLPIPDQLRECFEGIKRRQRGEKE